MSGAKRTSLRYRALGELAGVPHLVADGPASADSVLVLSHWPGSGTPWPLKADLSAEIAFRYLDDPSSWVEADWVSNDHLDIDGFVAVYALCHPELARGHRDLLVEVAAAGDFADRCSEAGAKAAFALGTLLHRRASPLPADTFTGRKGEVVAKKYHRLMPLVPDLLADLGGTEELWAEEWETLRAAEAAIDSGYVRLEEVPDAALAVVWLPPGWEAGVQRSVLQGGTPIHPLAVHRRTTALRVAYVDPSASRYRLVYRFESWVQLMSRRAGRADLRPLAKRLNLRDPASPDWIANGRKTFIAWLWRRDGSASGLSADDWLETVTEELRAAPITWTPYDPVDSAEPKGAKARY